MNSHDVLDADQPIPLGRPPVRPKASAHLEEHPVVEVPMAAPVPDAGVERSLAPSPAAVAAEPEAVPAMASTTPATTVSPPTVASRWPGPLPSAGQPEAHPMNRLRNFRLEPIPLEPAYGGRRDLVRFLVHYTLFVVLVYALIVVFVLLINHARGLAE